MKLAVAIPAFQAVYSVGSVVDQCRRHVEHVLVVDDGSHDDTAAAAAAAGADVRRVPINRGKGHALHLAFEQLFGAGFDAVITVDADGQHVPNEIPRLVALAPDADLVLGTRAHLFAQMSGLRRTANQLSSRAISFAAGSPIEDAQTGFRLYRRELIAHTGFPEERFDAESAVVVRAVRLGFRVRSTPVTLAVADGRLTSHYRPVVDSLRIAAAVAKARLTTRP